MKKGNKQAGKKGDKGPISDEKAAEYRRQQQLAARVELRQRMITEAKNSNVNKLKIQNQWRKIMRLAKAESLKKDVEILSQNHERDVDRKDAILQMLDRIMLLLLRTLLPSNHILNTYMRVLMTYRDLEEAEDQFQMALRTHLQNIDTLIQLHDSRLYSLEKNFQFDLKTMQTDFHKEKEIMLAKFKQEKKELIAVIETIEGDENDREAEAKHSFEQLREEIRNRNLEEINMLRISLDAQIEELEQHFETAHLNYLQQTAQRTHDFKELTQNDQRLSREIELKKKKIDNLQTTIQQWRAKIRQLNRETEERNRLLLEEKHSIQKHYQQLKQRIQAYRGTQNQRLLQLSQSANSCKESLNQKLALSARVMHLAELSRKMETEQEQVLPFFNGLNVHDEPILNPANNHNISEKQNSSSNLIPPQSRAGKDNSNLSKDKIVLTNQTSAWSAGTNQYIPHEDRLHNFHRKYNKALLDTIAIGKEKERLTEENAQLQDLITQFINGTRISDAILSSDNPLFVVNGRANLNHNPPVRMIRPTIQDAATIQNTNMIARR